MDAEPNYAMVKHYRKLMKDREDAHSRGDNLRYYRLTNELGATDRDENAYEQGEAEDMHLNSEEEKKSLHDVLRGEAVTSLRKGLEKMCRVALKRFPELERGESIGDKELSRRLREIREAGYNVLPYSHLNKDNKWALIMSIRKDLGSELRINLPEVAEEIRSQNSSQKDDAYTFR